MISRPSLTNGCCSFQAIHQRHGDIHQDKIRLQVGRQTDGLKTIAGLSDDANLQVSFQEISNSRAKILVIIYNQYSDHCSL